MVDAGVKRKRPPNFHHLPINRAKKVKRIWVENVKIKSKWKAQKRKELQLSTSAQGDAQDDNAKEDDDSESGAKESAEQEEDLAQDEIVPSLEKSVVHPSRAHKIPGKSPSLNNRQDDKNKNKASSSEETPSLRDLTRKAYSRSSLHSFKSDSSNRRRGTAVRGGRGSEKSAEWRQGRRGQPNMKLRMDAMLERIKRDFV